LQLHCRPRAKNVYKRPRPTYHQYDEHEEDDDEEDDEEDDQLHKRPHTIDISSDCASIDGKTTGDATGEGSEVDNSAVSNMLDVCESLVKKGADKAVVARATALLKAIS
jgi:hypothetical protein